MFKNLIFILILFVITAGITSAQVQDAYLEYTGTPYEFSFNDKAIFTKNAEKNMKLFEKASKAEDKKFYLQEAMRYYFLLEKIDDSSIEAQIGLGRIYDEMKLDRFAKEHFFNAMNFDNKHAKTNLYFADFYYKRDDLITALPYYGVAYKSYSNSYDLNYKLGIIYEKLADIQKANFFYKKALKIKPANKELLNKIRLLDDINYYKSQYYLFKK